MNINLVSDGLHPSISGGTRYVFGLANTLKKLGHSVTVTCANYDLNKKVGLRKFIIPRHSGICGLISFGILATKYAKEFDVINVFSYQGFGFSLIKMLNMLKKPVIVTLPSIEKIYPEEKLTTKLRKMVFYRYLLLLTAKYADKIIALVDPFKEYLIKFGINKEKISVIPPGVDCDVFKPKKSKFTQTYENYKVLIYVGWLGLSRNIRKLAEVIKAMKYVKEVFPKTKLLLIGSGKNEKLMYFIEKNDVEENVEIIGKIYDDKILSEYYSLADLCIIPTLPGLVLFEAMASGVPVITSAHPIYQSGNEWIIKNFKNGLLIDNFSSNTLSKSIITLLQDEKMLKRMRKFCRKTALNFDWNTIANRIVDVYKEVISQK